MGRYRQTGSKTTPAVAKAKERKRRNRAARQEQLRFEAGRLGITVIQLVGQKALEVAGIIKKRRVVYTTPVRPISRGYGYRH